MIENSGITSNTDNRPTTTTTTTATIVKDKKDRESGDIEIETTYRKNSGRNGGDQQVDKDMEWMSDLLLG